MLRRASQFFSELESDATQPLRLRLYRLFTATACVLCLAVVLPLNLLQHLPVWVNVCDVLMGLIAGYCFWMSGRGRFYLAAFFAAVVGLLDPAYFYNGGADSSIVYYFFILLLYPVTLFRGRTRWILAALLLLNLCALLLLEYCFPALSTPFPHRSDRLIDDLSGVFCTFLGVSAIIWLIIATYEREQKRVTDYTEKLAASARNYREIFNATSDALLIHDATGRIIDVNDPMCAMFGYTRDEALHLTVADISTGESPYTQADALRNIRRSIQAGPQVVRWPHRRRNGDVFWSEVVLRASEIGGQQRIIAAIRDITDRARAEQELRTSEERLRLSLSASRQAWFDLNLLTNEGSTNDEYPRMLGLDPATFRTTTEGWIAGLHPEDREAVVQEFKRCIATGESCQMEYRRKVHPDGWKWIRSTAQIVERDAAGRPLRMAGTHADITERKELEARLLHSQRLEAVGTIASGVAHDLNNILTPMLMASSVLQEKLPDPKDRELMALIEDGAKRGAGIVRQLLTFSRNLAARRIQVDPRQHVREIVGIMCSTFPPNIKVAEQIPSSVWPVNADPTQLYQVLMNLCVNARDAMPDGGTLSIALENVVRQPTGTSQHPWSRGGRFVLITVSDTGHGIPAAIIDRIFDPYFTTKDVGKGTGLGLSTVHGIVREHGGTIEVVSTPQQGACFRVFLPAAEPGTAAAAPGEAT